jgi:hypothetical protein
LNLRVACTSVLFLAAARAAGAYPSHSGGTGLFDVQSAHVPASGSVELGFSGVSYGVPERPGISGDVLDGGLRGSIALWGVVEAWGRWNAAQSSVDGPAKWGTRDGAAGAKLALPSGVPWIETALAGSVNLDWGDRGRGFSTDARDPSVSALLTFRLPESNPATWAHIHVNIGWRFHGDTRGRAYEGVPAYYLEPVYPEADNDRLDLRAALEFGSRKLAVFGEVLLDQLDESPDLSFGESPIFLTPGFRYAISESFGFQLASKIALAADNPGTARLPAPEDVFPDWQLGFSFAWSRLGSKADRDGDGVPDVRDRCPRDAEDLDGWKDADGCPEEGDRTTEVPEPAEEEPEVPPPGEGEASPTPPR